jgi:hypothetical protein
MSADKKHPRTIDNAPMHKNIFFLANGMKGEQQYFIWKDDKRETCYELYYRGKNLHLLKLVESVVKALKKRVIKILRGENFSQSIKNSSSRGSTSFCLFHFLRRYCVVKKLLFIFLELHRFP